MAINKTLPEPTFYAGKTQPGAGFHDPIHHADAWEAVFPRAVSQSRISLQESGEARHSTASTSVKGPQLAGEIAIVTPVLNDWMSFSRLLEEIARRYGSNEPRFHILAVNDGSQTGFTFNGLPETNATAIRSVEVVHLAVNLGHQRAIAVGLSVLAQRGDIATVVVMDCDGEDRPEDIATLLAASLQNPGKAVLARRSERSESTGFKIGYQIYKWLFWLLTGRGIDFGNFSVLPIAAVRRLVRMPDLWNNLPAAIMRSRLGTVAVPLPRGRRYAGQSQMNLAGLVVHGLSAMSVFSEVIFVRVLLGAIAASGLMLLLMLAVAAIRFLTDLAIPGWASTVFGDLAIMLAQMLVVIVATTFVVLSSRSQRPMMPIIDAASFIVEREVILPQTVPSA
ncbi:glycosyltransferase family 2 protein [Acidisphaera sp. S103]|uniref:glycosyltransferase family 2 protein n=1 Tax=Acidisphaera sp. S103 TaxID=1747223 RepID=UPI00131AF8FE|nr:glycosyltransferase family 2 protein [Acidisphaera sp. S103]